MSNSPHTDTLVGRRFQGRIDGIRPTILTVTAEHVAGMFVVIDGEGNRRPMRAATIQAGLDRGALPGVVVPGTSRRV